MRDYSIPLVNETGRRIGYGDRWWTHRVRESPGGPVLGQKHVGITITCVNDSGKVLLQHRRHKIFDKVWSLSGDTHPRKYKNRKVESLTEAATRCAKEDWGIAVKKWTQRIITPYSARDPRDPRYCENEMLYVLVGKLDGQVHMNKKNAYDLKFSGPGEIAKDLRVDSKKRPIDRGYAPWVHAIFSLPYERVKDAFRIQQR